MYLVCLQVEQRAEDDLFNYLSVLVLFLTCRQVASNGSFQTKYILQGGLIYVAQQQIISPAACLEKKSWTMFKDLIEKLSDPICECTEEISFESRKIK